MTTRPGYCERSTVWRLTFMAASAIHSVTPGGRSATVQIFDHAAFPMSFEWSILSSHRQSSGELQDGKWKEDACCGGDAAGHAGHAYPADAGDGAGAWTHDRAGD